MKAFIVAAFCVVSAAGALSAAAGPRALDNGALAKATPLAVAAGETDGAASVVRPAYDEIMPFEVDGDGLRYLVLKVPARGPASEVHFSNFRLGAGAAVYVYGVENGAVRDLRGPFTGAGPVNSGQFWSGAVSGEIYVELQMSGIPPAVLPFEISAVRGDRTGAVPALLPAAERAVRSSVYRDRVLAWEDREGEAIFENDIELGASAELSAAPAASKENRHESIGITGASYRWPGGVMPYEIEAGFPNVERVTGAISHWNAVLNGVVRMIPRTNETAYVIFRNSTDPGRCSSSVGRLGYGQAINIGAYCSTGNVIHEIGHAWGLWHEQSREDRDRYVRIVWANIRSGMSYNFNQQITSGDDLGAYDYGSIMHYHAYSFSANGQPTIETIPAGISIGQQSGLSSGDVGGIRMLYPSGTTVTPPPPTTTTPPPPQPPPAPATVSVTLQTNPAGLQLIVDGTTVTTPYAATWTAGSSHTIQAPGIGDANGVRTTFVSWSDSGAQSHTVAPSGTTIYTATYKRSYLFTATAQPYEGGSVSVSPLTTGGWYSAGSTVNLTATPAPGYCFTGWTGLLSGTPSSTSVPVNGPVSVAANFQTGSATVAPSVLSAVRVGGNLVTSVTANGGCGWAAQSRSSWISIAAPFNGIGSGSGTLTLAVQPNNTGRSRVGRVTVGTASVYVTQPGK